MFIFNESSKLFEKTLSFGVYELGYISGDIWRKVLHHSLRNKNRFSGPDEAAFIISSDDKFSILANGSNRLKTDSKPEPPIYYPEEDVYFKWKQRNNPLEEN